MRKQSGNAGRRGDSVRSDCWIEIEIRQSGGIQIEVVSKVDALYGESIRSLLMSGAEHFNLQHAVIRIEDQGALPFIQMARFEAALQRLNPDEKLKPWLPENVQKQGQTDRRRSRRSRLYLPGNEPKFMISAALHSPEGLIYDLEDSVAPSEKDAARVLVRNALLSLDCCGAERMVRINQGDRGLDDLEWVVPYGVHLILIPKVESAAEVIRVAEHVAQISMREGRKNPVWLMPIVESAKGGWFAYDIASAHDTVVSLALGLEDYTADIGVQRTNEGRESFWVRAQVINGARAAGVQPIDTVFSDVGDMEGLLDSVREAKALGFEGKGCIHPRQIAVVHQGFAPEADEIEKAKKIVLAFEKADAEGLGVVSLGSKMIDPPVVKRALHTVNLALKDGLLDENWRDNTE